MPRYLQAPKSLAPSLPKAFEKSAITNRALALKTFTPRFLYIINEVRRLKNEKTMAIERPEAAALRREVAAKFDAGLPAKELAVWEKRTRDHDAAQVHILDSIIEVLRNDPSLSFEAVAAKTTPPNWISGEGIRKLFVSLKYSKYMERIIPLLTRKQMRDAVTFSKHLRSNWGRGAGKYLLIHFDEKWFYGMLVRFAKACEILGLSKRQLFARHKLHIPKVMIMVLTGFAFEDNYLNGGIGVKLGCLRIQGVRIAQREVNETVVHWDGSITRPNEAKGGKKIRSMGETYPTGCAITGSNVGTSSAPKFSLKRCFARCFEQVEQIVAPSGLLPGYKPVWQGDRAGPHEEGQFTKWAKAECARRSWLWEPQSPNSPGLNAQDLMTFPLMSRRHSTFCRENARAAPDSETNIMKNVDKVWAELSSADIAKAHILAFEVAKKRIAARGGNGFLNGKLHSGIRETFRETDTGLVRKDGKVLGPPGAGS